MIAKWCHWCDMGVWDILDQGVMSEQGVRCECLTSAGFDGLAALARHKLKPRNQRNQHPYQLSIHPESVGSIAN